MKTDDLGEILTFLKPFPVHYARLGPAMDAFLRHARDCGHCSTVVNGRCAPLCNEAIPLFKAVDAEIYELKASCFAWEVGAGC